MLEGMEFQWWAGGVPDTDGDCFVAVDKEADGRIILTAGQHDYEVWGRVWLPPEVARQVAAALLAAAGESP